MIIEKIESLYKEVFQLEPKRIEKLPQSGSDRLYFRVFGKGDRACIATYNYNEQENRTFLAFTKSFRGLGLPVPEIFGVSADYLLYLQEDFGSTSLAGLLESEGHSDRVYKLFQKSLAALARLQISGHDKVDYRLCLTSTEFGKQAILSDLLYFKYYFLDFLGLPYNKQQLLDEFDVLSVFLGQSRYKYFMFRDFQSRNIMIKEEEVFFIDYQGGMNGGLQYDAAALLWQAKANLPKEWKDALLDYYMEQVDGLVANKVDKNAFRNQFKGFVLIRLLQVLGAYGFRGLFQRKAAFLAGIPIALDNLKKFTDNNVIGIELPEFERILGLITGPETKTKFLPVQASDKTPLVVEINSFSYKKGIPEDKSSNGGGFVFDCRGILNPGRQEEFKKLTGQDKPVQDYLQQRTSMNEFLNSVFDLVSISVENYISRDFAHLQINFGCTGGQHRSVYSADQTARYLKNKYKVKVILTHTNKDNWVQ
ncbi:RapZ C-terminal domain-containing protein [Arachidicoccus terrestris]|uniref:RapZ C-terminal domain-containing protein n=1 Tax=Arachidicoccus terrestris TaxID=2875539 RepID=UPI001CC62385|nr:RNase adapter RapZ [Arachidicoccus terrestris]UAY54131.1 phosphotransferase [Arachidicoccus terrestris]